LGALFQAFVSSIDPNIAERIIRPAKAGQQQVVNDEQQDLAQIFAGIPKNIRIGTPPQLGLQVIQQYLQQPDVQQRYSQDNAFRERIDARAKQYQFQAAAAAERHHWSPRCPDAWPDAGHHLAL
jgi:aspartate/tyrosine/aromatic aminotransferase